MLGACVASVRTPATAVSSAGAMRKNFAEVEPTLTQAGPTVDLAPSEVVQFQMEALRRAAIDPVYFDVCYRFASPRNRAFIGSSSDFQAMLRKSFDNLIGHQIHMVGQEFTRGNAAEVIVTGIDANGYPMCFQFILGRQSTGDFADCWMTDSVIPIVRKREPAAATTPVSAIDHGGS